MSAINFIITKSCVIVCDGQLLTNQIVNLAGDEAKYGLYLLDNLEPAAKPYIDADAWIGIAQSANKGDVNETVKQVLSSVFGATAGVIVGGISSPITASRA